MLPHLSAIQTYATQQNHSLENVLKRIQDERGQDWLAYQKKGSICLRIQNHQRQTKAEIEAWINQRFSRFGTFQQFKLSNSRRTFTFCLIPKTDAAKEELFSYLQTQMNQSIWKESLEQNRKKDDNGNQTARKRNLLYIRGTKVPL